MKAFVTGGTGFIGSHIVRKLLLRGYEVHLLARCDASLAKAAELGAQPVPGDIHDVDSMRAAMRGCEVVFNIAALYQVGFKDIELMERVNVEGAPINIVIPGFVYGPGDKSVGGETFLMWYKGLWPVIPGGDTLPT